MWHVKTPTPPPEVLVASVGEMRARTWGYLPLAAAVALALCPAAALASGGEPLCEWLSGLGEAAQAEARGDAQAAEIASRRALAARPHGPAGARAQAALGLALLLRDQPAPAAEALEVALQAPMPGHFHLAFARGEALLAAGEPARAASLFSEAAAADLALAPRARLREAQALLAAGLAAEAVPTLQALVAAAPDDPSAPSARLALAQGLRALGQDELAIGAYRALWLDFPERPEARAAGEALAAWRLAGGRVPAESAADRVARAERLLAAGWPEDALLETSAAIGAVEAGPDDERISVVRAAAQLALGRNAEAERAALALVGSTSESVERGARLVLARVAARAGRVEEATRYYAEVASGTAPVPGLPEPRQRDLSDESAFLAAWLFYDAGELRQAIPLLEAFARTHRRSHRAPDALWFAAWSRYRLGRRDDADRSLAALERGALADRAFYWRARLARDRDRQRALYRSAASAGGTGWYGLLARGRLTALGERAGRPHVPAARAIPDVQDVRAAGRLSIAAELLGLGLREDALRELRALGRGSHARAAAWAIAQLATFAEDAELPFRMARDHLLQTRRTLRWAYPEPHGELIRPAARGFGVDPALLLAVIRRESAFRSEVRSGAGAEGLLQLRPSTAERLASLLRLPGPTAARLAEPAVAISLGAQYLGLLESRFGDPAVAVAAYNAGPAPVAGWLRARAGMPLDAWIESIPYRETRQYVKIVVSQWDVYRALSGLPPPQLDPERPVAEPGSGVAF